MNLEFNKNEDAMKLALAQINKHLEKIAQGGGKKSLERQREKNKLTARERIEYLRDKDKPFVEIDAFAGFDMYEKQGDCPARSSIDGLT
jgi:acetyl-CoA carboxylase carboxyltransferase component